MKPLPQVIARLNELKSAQPTLKTDGRDSLHYARDMGEYQRWATSVLSVLSRIFGEQSVHYRQFEVVHRDFGGWDTDFQKCWGIFLAAKDDYEGGFLFNHDSLVAADVFDDELEQAEELLRNNFITPACVVTGIVLETMVKRLCAGQIPTITIAKFDLMNADLTKANVYNKSMQKQLTAWYGLRNDAAHGNGAGQTAAEIKAMIEGVRRFIGDYLN